MALTNDTRNERDQALEAVKQKIASSRYRETGAFFEWMLDVETAATEYELTALFHWWCAFADANYGTSKERTRNAILRLIFETYAADQRAVAANGDL